MLAVVEDQKGLSASEMPEQNVGQLSLLLLADA
jgi:hypothetical protein